MQAILEKNRIDDVVESDEEVTLILERLKEAKEGKVMSLDEAVEKYVKENKIWKNLI